MRRLRRWIPLALPVAMCWLLYANVSAFRVYQSKNAFSFYALKARAPYPPAGWRPPGFSSRDYYWLQDVLRGTTLVMPPDVEINLGLWRHLALVNPVPGTHRRIGPALADELADGAELVKFRGSGPPILPGPKMLKGRIYFREPLELMRGKRAYWVVERLRPRAKFPPRTFVLSETLFERHFGSPQ